MVRSPAARRYAKAIFELAREEGKLDVVQADLAEIKKLTAVRDQYIELLSPYALTEANRANLWRAILGAHADPLVMRFILFLVRKNRAQILGDIIERFTIFYNEAKGIVAIRLISAKPLAAEQVASIEKHFETRLGKKISTQLEIDSGLLGGFQVYIGDVVHDYSVNHQLNLLHRKMITA